MANIQLLADLGNGEKGHHSKVDPELIAMFVRELHSQVAVDRSELQLGVRHDGVCVEGLARLVQPDLLLWPPEGKV